MRVVRLIVLLAASLAVPTGVALTGCVDPVATGTAQQAEQGGDQTQPDAAPGGDADVIDPACDLDHDGHVGPQCDGCDQDDLDPDLGCRTGCFSVLCRPPIDPPVLQ